MSELKLPTFNFGANGKLDATAEEVAASAAPRFTDTNFKPGKHTLKILSCAPYKQSEKDGNWWVYKCVLTLEGTGFKTVETKSGKTYEAVVNSKGQEVASITTWPLVPVTGSIKYNPDNSKAPLFVFQNFRRFMAGLGVQVEAEYESVKSAVMGNFAKPGVLDGRTLTVEIGYGGPYIIREGEVWLAKDKDGANLTDETFASKDLAKAYGLDKGLDLKDRVEVTKYFAPEKVEQPVQKAAKVAW